VVALGKRISDRIYLTYEQGIGTVVQSLVKIDLSLTNRISLRAQTGTTSGLGAYYRYSWD
jgi:translocation and assembly module TamB